MARHSNSSDEARVLRVITIDQAIAGASNFLIALLAAGVLKKSMFGLFGIIFIVYSIVVGISRALICDPLLVHPEQARSRPGDPIGASIVLGLGMSVVMLGAGAVTTIWSHTLGYALLAFAVCLGPLIMQDLGRYLGFATKRPGRAVVLDSVWLVAVIIAVAVLLVLHVRSLTWFIAAWGATGGATGALTFWQNRGYPVRPGVSWIRFTWPFSWRYLISYSSSQGAGLVASSVLGAKAGTAALGGVQGSITAVRPFGTIQIASVAAGTGEIARSGYTPIEAYRRGIRISMLVTVVALANVAFVLYVPGVGHALLHDTWSATKPLMLAQGAQIACLGIITGARAGLLGLRAAQRTVKIDVVNTVLVLVTSITGVIVHGVLGAMWGVAICQAVMACVWWSVFRWHLSHPLSVVSTDEEIERAERQPAASYPQTGPPIRIPRPLLLPPVDPSVHAGVPTRTLTPWTSWR